MVGIVMVKHIHIKIYIVKYKISKLGQNAENEYAGLSYFGDSQESFEGHSNTPPTIGERFVLRDKRGNVVINTSTIVEEPTNGVMKTLYSIYKIEEDEI